MGCGLERFRRLNLCAGAGGGAALHCDRERGMASMRAGLGAGAASRQRQSLASAALRWCLSPGLWGFRVAIWACWASRAGDGGWSGSREGQRRPVALRPPVDGGLVGNRGDRLPAVATLSRAATPSWPGSLTRRVGAGAGSGGETGVETVGWVGNCGAATSYGCGWCGWWRASWRAREARAGLLQSLRWSREEVGWGTGGVVANPSQASLSAYWTSRSHRSISEA